MSLNFTKSKNWGTVKYAISNFAMPIFIGWVGWLLSYAVGYMSGLLIVLIGILFILSALKGFGETNMGTTIFGIILGIVLVSFGGKIQEYPIAIKIGEIVVLLFIIWRGFLLRYTITRDKLGRGTSFELPIRILAFAMFILIFFGGLVNFVGVILSFIEGKETLASTFSNIGGKMITFGCISWVARTIVILIHLKKNHRYIRSNSNNGSNISNVRATQGGANESKVRTEMQSLANYLTGGYDFIIDTLKVVYKVSATVSNGNINFTITSDVQGNTSSTNVDLIKGKISSAVSKRQQLVLNKAKDRLSSIRPDRDYSITVETQ